ncbi:hypothetical protein [Borrelia coriaceae]|uniref:hypothetical protein n=1 Tax=Borrelia coriaceae TaxID=144 RepID=UPI00046D0127|nr:hypothetical protein [Borrelia coriaceae]
MINDKEHIIGPLGLSVIGAILGLFLMFVLCLVSKIISIIFINLDFPEFIRTIVFVFASIVVFKCFKA